MTLISLTLGRYSWYFLFQSSEANEKGVFNFEEPGHFPMLEWLGFNFLRTSFYGYNINKWFAKEKNIVLCEREKKILKNPTSIKINM